MIFDIQRKLTDLNKRVFDLENVLARFQPAKTILEELMPPPWLPWVPPLEPPHALGGPRHIGVGDGLERDGTDLQLAASVAGYGLTITPSRIMSVGAGSGLVVSTDSIAIDLVSAWSGLEFLSGDLRVDQTKQFAWTGRHQFGDGIEFVHASTDNIIYVLDDLLSALRVIDTMGWDYLSIRTLDTQPFVVFNADGRDIDFRVGSTGSSHSLFVRGSDGRRGMGVGDPAAELHIVSTAVTNVHRPAYGTPTLILDDGSSTAVTLQLAARNYSTRMCHVVLTGAPTTGNNKHWIVSHLGPDVSNRFSIGYLSSPATDFSTWADVSEYLTISTAGVVNVHDLAGTGTRNVSADANGNLVIA